MINRHLNLLFHSHMLKNHTLGKMGKQEYFFPNGITSYPILSSSAFSIKLKLKTWLWCIYFLTGRHRLVKVRKWYFPKCCVVQLKKRKVLYSSSEKWQNCQFKEVKLGGQDDSRLTLGFLMYLWICVFHIKAFNIFTF